MNVARWVKWPWTTRELLGVVVLVIASVPLLFFDLGGYGLVNGDEGFYHDIARSMVESGDWTRIEFAGNLEVYGTFTHAPLFIWLKAGVITLLGDGYWSMRLVSAGFALITVLVVYAFGLRLMSAGFALVAALLLLTTYQFVFLHSGRTGEMEPVIACFALLAPLLLIRALERGTSLVPHHLCLVALFNLKAAFIVIPIAAEMLYFIVVAPHRARFRDWLRDALWVLPLGAAWHIYHLATDWGRFVETLGILSGHAAGGSDLEVGVLRNSRFYLQTLFWGGFPHSLLYPLVVFVFVAPSVPHCERHRWRLLGCYALISWSYFSLVVRHFPWYVNPLYGFFALAIAGWLSWLAAGSLSRVSLALGAGLLAVLPWTRIDWFNFNPFADVAMNLRPRVEWVGWGSVSGVVCATLTLVVVSACVWLLLWLRGRGVGQAVGAGVETGRARQVCAVVCSIVLVSAGAARVSSSLKYTDHVSPLEKLALDLEARRAAGRPVPYPIDLPCGGAFEKQFLFYRDHEMRFRRTRRCLDQPAYVLIGPRL